MNDPRAPVWAGAPESRDQLTIKLLRQAESNLETALKTMPNLIASAFGASDARDVAEALRRVQVVRSDAENARANAERRAAR